MSDTDSEQKKTEQEEGQQATHSEEQKTEQISQDQSGLPSSASQEEIQKDLEKAKQYKSDGNVQFQQENYDEALAFYEKAIQYCPDDQAQQLAIFNSNIAICYLKKQDYDSVIHYTTSCIQLDKGFKKAYLNRSIAYEQTNKEEEALEDLKEAEKIDPGDKELKKRIFLLEKKVAEVQEKRKTEVLSNLKDLGNSILGKFGLSLDNFKMQKNENGSYNIQYNNGPNQ